MTSTKLLTAEDLWEMEDDGCRHELIRGELISMSPTSDPHGETILTLSWHIKNYLRTHPEVRGWAGDTGFLLSREPDVLLAPDLAMTSQPVERKPSGFLEAVPELVIDVLSPSERIGQVSQKVEEYLAARVKLIWLVDPALQNVTIHAAHSRPRIVQGDDILSGGDTFPDLEIHVADIFE